MPTTKATRSRGRSPKVIAKPSELLIKLDIACGQNKQVGFTGIDIAPCDGVDIVHDLTIYPWPIEDKSVGQAFCSHYVEHIPMTEPFSTRYGRGQDSLLMFFDELYRILAPEGQVTIVCPYYSSMRAWQDPTHRRAISEATFLYANKGWRETNRLNHYPVSCDFDFAYAYTVDRTWAVRNEETRGFAFRHYINAVDDIQVTMTKRG